MVCLLVRQIISIISVMVVNKNLVFFIMAWHDKAYSDDKQKSRRTALFSISSHTKDRYIFLLIILHVYFTH